MPVSDLRYWLWLAERRNLPTRAALRYLRAFGSAKALFLAEEGDLLSVAGARKQEVLALSDKQIAATERLEETCAQQGLRIYCLQDAAYPDRLRSLEDPPLVIYVKGKLPAVDDRVCIGVVGTRRASEYGLETAGRIGGELAAAGAVVVTGLAAGIDSAAARGALRVHGQVVGVLGTGLDVVYPAENKKLQKAVGELGALVSEYPPGTGATKLSFPRRNRIISGLSLGVAIVEAPRKSGALITAARAQEQGRDVFVVPGSVSDPGFAGSNDLIRDGAALIRGGADILLEYRDRYPQMLVPGRQNAAETSPNATKNSIDKAETVGYSSLKEQLGALSEAELQVVAALSGGERYADEIIRRTGLPAAEALAAATMLQLRGYAEERGGVYRLLIRRVDPPQEGGSPQG